VPNDYKAHDRPNTPPGGRVFEKISYSTHVCLNSWLV